MTAKILAGVALFFAIVALILKSVAVSVPHFVDVHLVDDPENANDGNRLGGVGVFTSEFNSELEGDILVDIQAANVPPLNIELPTLEFPLLFPSQENFIFDVLPLSDDLLDALDATFNNAIKPDIEAEQDAVQNLEFNGNCNDFATAAEDSVQAFFRAFQADTLPVAIGGVGQTIVGQLDELIITQAIEGTLNQGAGLIGVSLGVANGVFENAGAIAGNVAACDGLVVDENLTMADDGRACLAGVFGGAGLQAAGAFPGSFATFLSALITTDCDDAETLGACIVSNAAKFVLVDNELTATAQFANNAEPQLCTVLCQPGNVLKVNFLADVVFPAFDNSGDAQLEAAAVGYQQYLGIFQAGLLTDETFAEGFPQILAAAGLSTFDDAQNGTQAYAPCTVLNVASTGANCVTLEDYLTILPAFLEAQENELAGTVKQIADLYLLFFATGLPLGATPIAFTGGLLSGAYQTDLVPDENGSVAASVAAECEFDVEDNDKIAQAQVLVVTSTVFEGLAILLVIVGVILPVDKLAFLAPAGAVASVLGGIGILGALFVVRSAPVYEGVGDEGDGELDIFFIQGYVPLLALVDAVLFFLCAVLLVASTVLACKEKNAEEAGEEAAAEEKEDAMAAKMEDNL